MIFFTHFVCRHRFSVCFIACVLLRCAALRLTLSLISVNQKGVQDLIKYSSLKRAARQTARQHRFDSR